MVYIRPSAPVVTPTGVKPIGDPEHTPVIHELADGASTSANQAIKLPEQERRKQDRRQQRKDALLETRTSSDRRRNNSISISI